MENGLRCHSRAREINEKWLCGPYYIDTVNEDSGSLRE